MVSEFVFGWVLIIIGVGPKIKYCDSFDGIYFPIRMEFKIRMMKKRQGLQLFLINYTLMGSCSYLTPNIAELLNLFQCNYLNDHEYVCDVHGLFLRLVLQLV